MIIRRFLYILLSVFFLVTSPVIAENEKDKISFMIMEDENEIYLCSSLIPDSRITIFHPEATDLESFFSLIRPDFLPELINCFKDVITETNKEKATVYKGFYVGELFEHATEREFIELNREEIKHFCTVLAENCHYSSQTEADPSTNKSKCVESILDSFVDYLFDYETTACISTFDKQYITINIVRQHKPIAVISADFSAKDSFRILVARSAGDATYFEELTCKNVNDKIEYTVSLYRTETSSFRMISEQDCLQFAEIRCINTENERYSFEGEIQSVLLTSAAHVRGSRMIGEDNRDVIRIEMEIEENAQEIIGNIFQMLKSR